MLVTAFILKGLLLYRFAHVEMPSLKTKCKTCVRKFLTQRSLKKHEEQSGHINQEADIEFFKQCGTEPLILLVPKEIVPAQQAAYREFLIGMAELTNSFLKPDVKSK